MRLYVGNLPFSTTDEQLRELFAQFGTVVSASVLTDKHSGRSRGFGFVEMDSDEAGQAAVTGLADAELGGRPLKVQPAKPAREFGSD